MIRNGGTGQENNFLSDYEKPSHRTSNSQKGHMVLSNTYQKEIPHQASTSSYYYKNLFVRPYLPSQSTISVEKVVSLSSNLLDYFPLNG